MLIARRVRTGVFGLLLLCCLLLTAGQGSPNVAIKPHAVYGAYGGGSTSEDADAKLDKAIANFKAGNREIEKGDSVIHGLSAQLELLRHTPKSRRHNQ